MLSLFHKVERVLSAVTALLLFTLNEVRMFNLLPRNPGSGQTHAMWVRIGGGADQVFGSVFDLTARYGLVTLTVVLSAWAVAETLRKQPATAEAEAD
ncbi:hypothetical protein [Terricaulis sp.]|uniref:hypothetical protein n=1 Tax=Terricaulis sp. TaxID=2768686 RepID=UPI003785089C